MKRALLGLMAAIGLSSCSAGGEDPLAGTIGTGNTAGVAGVKLTGSGSEVGAKVYLYKADSLAYPVAVTSTDAQGNYRFDKLPVGSYKLFLDQNSMAGAFQDLVIKEGEETKTTVELRPYVFMRLDTVVDGYCGVGANALVKVGGTQTLVRVPQQTGSLSLVSGTSSELSVAWDSAAGVSTLSRAGKAVYQESVLVHAGLVFATPVSKTLKAGLFSAWNPPSDGTLRVGMVFTLAAPLGDTTSLITFGNVFSFQIKDSILVFDDGISPKPLRVIPMDLPQYLEVSLDGATGDVSVDFGSLGSSSRAMFSDYRVVGLSNAADTLRVGSPFVLLHGASVDLVKSVVLATPRVESSN